MCVCVSPKKIRTPRTLGHPNVTSTIYPQAALLHLRTSAAGGADKKNVRLNLDKPCDSSILIMLGCFPLFWAPWIAEIHQPWIALKGKKKWIWEVTRRPGLGNSDRDHEDGMRPRWPQLERPCRKPERDRSIMILTEGSLEAKLPTIWTDEKQSREEAERRDSSEEKRSEERRCRCAKR